MSKLQLTYYTDQDVVRMSRNLLGKVLFTCMDQKLCGGIIVETEAYSSTSDRASHAYGNKRTKRTENMYHRGGISYVYLCYGIHPLFNIVTGEEGIPDAVLIRAIKPYTGIDEMNKRRGMSKGNPDMNGPGKVTKALNIKISHNGVDLMGNVIWLEDIGIKVPQDEIWVGPRVGVDYAGEDALLPYRFIWKND